MQKGLIKGADGKIRCSWPGDDPLYQAYHDNEWGHPVGDDRALFQKITLDGFQAGLSWITILRKRENFIKAFDNFDIATVANYSEKDVERLLQNEGIIRHRGKIEGTITNAQGALKIIEEFGSLGAYIWQFEPKDKDRPKRFDYDTLMKLTATPESTALSKDLKKRGWKFVGPTIIYAFMQAIGMVNDHIEGCDFRKVVEEKRKAFKRPT